MRQGCLFQAGQACQLWRVLGHESEGQQTLSESTAGRIGQLNRGTSGARVPSRDSVLLRPGDTGTNANGVPFTRCLLPALALREAKAKAPGEWQCNSIVPDQSSGLTIGTATAARRVAPMDGRHEPLLCPEGIGGQRSLLPAATCPGQARAERAAGAYRRARSPRNAKDFLHCPCLPAGTVPDPLACQGQRQGAVGCQFQEARAAANRPAPRPAKSPLYVLPPRKPAPDYNGGRQAERAKVPHCRRYEFYPFYQGARQL